MNPIILLYEELSLNALPATQTQFYDGWVLRFTSGYGYTNRANSVNLLYLSTLAPEEKIAECESRYFAQGRPAVFKITDSTDTEIDKLLEQKGYSVLHPTYIMAADLTAVRFVPGDCDFTSYIDDEWLDAYFRLSKYTDSSILSVARQVFGSIKVDVLCGRIIKNGQIIACGLCVMERGYAGIYNVVVHETQRGKGYGRSLCRSLLAAAQRLGAHTSYLQVVQDNRAAIHLYEKFGYKTVYSYWYRVKKGEA